MGLGFRVVASDSPATAASGTGSTRVMAARLRIFLHNFASILTFSTGVSGRMPCPKLKMCPGRQRSAAECLRTRLHSGQPAKSSTGSRFPCTAPDPTASQPDPAESASPDRSPQRRFLSSTIRGSAVRAKINDRHSGLLQRLHQLGSARQYITPIVRDAQTSHPTVEYLDRVRAHPHLFSRISATTATSLPRSSSQAVGEEYIIFLVFT